MKENPILLFTIIFIISVCLLIHGYVNEFYVLLNYIGLFLKILTAFLTISKYYKEKINKIKSPETMVNIHRKHNLQNNNYKRVSKVMLPRNINLNKKNNLTITVYVDFDNNNLAG